MSLYKKSRILIFLFFIIALFAYIIFVNDELVCKIRKGIEKDVCFSNLMLNQDRKDILKHIENDLIRDVSYWTLIIKEVEDGLHENYDCNLIENTYLRYMCIRLGFRPHMAGFITSGATYSAKNDFDSLLDKCNYYDGNIKLFCVYTNAAIMARYNFSQAGDVCSQLNDERLIGECSFYIASSFAMNIAHKTSERIDIIMDFCEKIIHPDWRSECYYVLADELALQKPERLEDIAIACRKSNLAMFYGCFDHVEHLLPTEKLLEFCGLTESSNEKGDCFLGYGVTISRRFQDNINSAIPACNKIPIEFRNYCFEGLGGSVGFDFRHDISAGIAACNKFPVEFRNYCFEELGRGVGSYFSHDISAGISACNKFPAEFRNYCFEGLGGSVGFDFRRDIFADISACNKFPVEFRNYCFEGLSRSVGFNFRHDISAGIAACNKFPAEFRNYCFDVVDNTLFIS